GGGGGNWGRDTSHSLSVKAEFHVIDLVGYRGQDGGPADGDSRATEGVSVRQEEGHWKSGEREGVEHNQQRKPTPVLNPVEREMDEAIFNAFRGTDPAAVAILPHAVAPQVNYHRRLGDGTTALMAAAHTGHGAVVQQLLTLGARPLDVDSNGRSAADLAIISGHLECAALIHRAAVEEGEGKGRGGGGDWGWGQGNRGGRRGEGGEGGGKGQGDFVYDLY
ncbi:unnamed protein product, partial [Discosporangium mesarthrocarpum]